MLIIIIIASITGIIWSLNQNKYAISTVRAETNSSDTMPYLDTINFTLLDEWWSLYDAMKEGDIDLGSGGVASIIPASLDPDILLTRSPGRNLAAITFNLRRQPFDLLPFRKAVAYSCDRTYFVENVYAGEAVSLHSMLTPAYKEYFNPNVQEYPYDLDYAISILDGANIVDTDTDLDEWREDPRTGENIQFELMSTPHNQYREQIAERICEDLRSINIDAIKIPFDGGMAEQHDFDAFFVHWGYGSIPLHLKQVFHSNSPEDLFFNIAGYNNPAYDTVIDAALAETDISAQINFFHQAQDYLTNDLPWLPLYTVPTTILSTPNFQGYIPTGGEQLGMMNYYSMLNVRPAEGYSSKNLRIGLGMWLEVPNPFTVGTINGELGIDLIFDTLMIKSPSGRIEGRLAQKWEVSSDGLEYTFNIAPNAKWHDETPLTSADVVFTYNYILQLGVDLYYGDLSHITDIYPINNTAFTIEVDSPRPFGLYEFGLYPIIPQHIWSNIENPFGYYEPYQIGSGPFKVISWSENDEMILGRNPDYFKQLQLGESGSGLSFEIDATETAQSTLNVESAQPIEVDVTVTNPPDTAFFESLVGALEISANISSGFTIEIRMYYTEAEVAGIDESQLKLYYWNKETYQWEIVPDSGVNTVENYVYGTVDHLSIFGALVPKSSSSLLTRLHTLLEIMEASDFRGRNPEETRTTLILQVEKIQELIDSEKYLWAWLQLRYLLRFKIRFWVSDEDARLSLLYLVDTASTTILEYI